MSASSNPSSKLGIPVKKSVFERQREEAEAKKAREEAETAAVLQEFEKSFEDDSGRPTSTPSRPIPSAPGKRHFTSSGLKSGPGSLGPAATPRSGPGSLGPAFNRKRHFDEYADRRDRRGGVRDEKQIPSADDIEDDNAAARPTLHMASLPPGTSPTVVKALLAQSSLRIEGVQIMTPKASDGVTTERSSTTAIIALAPDTPGADIDAVISQLQNRYLGFGYNLSISRHLSSTVVNINKIPSGNLNDLPFGAKSIQQQSSLSRAPPPNQRFAPPQSYTSSTPYARSSTQVIVQPPSDLKQLKLIHKTLEALLTYGPEFEALLMSRPEVQKDEQWSWLFNSRSRGGVYYRWRLWEILTDAARRKKHGRYVPEMLFEGQSIWQPPEESLRFEYTTGLDEFVSDNDYNSSDEEDDDEGGIAARYNDHTGANQADPNDGTGYLNPMASSKLIHLLSRLPDTSAKLRRGDVARVTAFAIDHAGAGGDEVSMLITRNVVKPFNLSGDDHDTSGSSQVGLYIISDILSTSASAGVRHAWRYRTLFENALRRQKVWEKLGRAEKEFAWGKLKADKWKRSIQALLSLWEGWSVFPQASQEEFTNSFLNPPLSKTEQAEAEAAAKRRAEDEAKQVKSVNRWKSVDNENNTHTASDIDMPDVDGTAMADESDMDIDENIDGVPMDDSSDEDSVASQSSLLGKSHEGALSKPSSEKVMEDEQVTDKVQLGFEMVPGKRQRPRAADMFADESE